ncbi:MAG: DUF1615 domain-containing protein [Burkholderiaceae bacterium]
MLAIVLAAGCAAERQVKEPRRSPAEVRAQLVASLPAGLTDREGWASDIQVAFERLGIAPTTENLCAALAVTEQESTFTVDPAVPGLPKIAREEIDRRAARLGIPSFFVRAALQLESGNGRTYAERISTIRTEHELSRLYEDLIGQVPLGKQLFSSANPVRTGGPMQVGIGFSERHASERPYPFDHNGSIRDEVFTRRGGLYFGIAHLLGYPASYDRHLYRFADFNAGWYASRNAAFQAAVAAASGMALTLDGDLIVPDGSRGQVGATEAAVRSLGPLLGIGDTAIRQALEQGDRQAFERTELYNSVFALAERKSGRPLPRAVIPRIDLRSPKITRKLTTEWFANRVQQRFERCVGKEAVARR